MLPRYALFGGFTGNISAAWGIVFGDVGINSNCPSAFYGFVME
ncbi:hypothetical protein [Herpetosiphon gulosus]